MAVLDVIEEENLQENALIVGAYLKKGIKSLSSKYDLIGDVRGKGFFLAVEMIKDSSRTPATQSASNVVQELKKCGILTNTIGPDENILKLRPPMVFSRENADFFLQQLKKVLNNIC